MKVIKPTAFLTSMLVSSSATDADAAWASGTTYAANARVTYAGRIYVASQGSNLGRQPDTNPAWWTDVGPSNRMAAFDQQISTATSGTGPLTMTVATQAMDTLAVVGVNATTAQLVVRDGSGGAIVYDRTLPMTGGDVADWSQYFFNDPTIRRTQGIFTGIPLLGSSHATLTFAGTGTVSVGAVVFGRINHLGDTQYGARAGLVDFSRKDTDAFGTATFVRRAFSKRVAANVQISNGRLNAVHRLLVDLRATPCVWIASDSTELEEALVAYGWYRDFSIDIAYPRHSLCALEIEGLA